MERLAKEPQFQYQPLPDPKIFIRLIEVHSVDENPQLTVNVVCSLEIFPLEHAPPYHAISYTWGDSSRTRYIRVNGRLMCVGENCEYVLRQAWWHKGCRYHWVDAICINQNDILEKTDQVRMMSQLYQSAALVLACVGPHMNESEFLFRMLREQDPEWRAGTRELSISSALSLQKGLVWSLIKWAGGIRFSNIRRIHDAQALFVQRPYFSRLWVVQELVFAERIIICCGREVIPLENLIRLRQVLRNANTLSGRIRSHKDPKDQSLQTIGEKQKPEEMGINKIRKGMLVLAGRSPFLRRFLVHELETPVPILEIALPGRRIYNLHEAFLQTHALDCKDPRDRVYGILSFINWKGTDPIDPDYSSSVFDLAIRVLLKYRELDILALRKIKANESWDAGYCYDIMRVALCLIGALHITTDAQEESTKNRLYGDLSSPIQPYMFLPIERCRGCKWIGWVLEYNGRWEIVNSFHRNWSSFEYHSSDGFVRIAKPSSPNPIALPDKIRPGDWLIIPYESPECYTNVCLLIRESENGLAVIGQGIGEYSQLYGNAYHSLAKQFEVDFDVVDLLVLLSWPSVSTRFSDTAFPPEMIRKRVNTRVCRRKWSTRAYYTRFITEPWIEVMDEEYLENVAWAGY